MKPHKVRYYLERRDPDFAEKMAEVLCVYRQVKILKKAAAVSKTKPSDQVAIVSYDEKPGIQAIAMTVPDLPSGPGVHATFAREHEYKRHGTVVSKPGCSTLISRHRAHPPRERSIFSNVIFTSACVCFRVYLPLGDLEKLPRPVSRHETALD